MSSISLLNILERLIECIEGEYFISDGALLGIIREGKLIDYDKDIDLYLLKNSKINFIKLSKNNLEICKYYLCDKVYDPCNPKAKVHEWNTYLSYKKLIYPNLDRRRLFHKCKDLYLTEKKETNYSNPHIDIFYLNDDLSFEYGYLTSKYKFSNKELFPLKLNNTLGFNIYIPNNPISVLERLYGTSWHIKNPLFKIY